MTFDDAHDESFSVPAFISSEIILYIVDVYYTIVDEPLQTIVFIYIEKYTLLQYTIFQLKIISDLYYIMFNTN